MWFTVNRKGEIVPYLYSQLVKTDFFENESFKCKFDILQDKEHTYVAIYNLVPLSETLIFPDTIEGHPVESASCDETADHYLVKKVIIGDYMRDTFKLYKISKNVDTIIFKDTYKKSLDSMIDCLMLAYRSNPDLLNVISPFENKEYINLNGSLISKDGKTFLKLCNRKCLTIPEGVEIIRSKSIPPNFKASVVFNFPSTLKFIEDDAFIGIGEFLKNNSLPENITKVSNVYIYFHKEELSPLKIEKGNVIMRSNITDVSDGFLFELYGNFFNNLELNKNFINTGNFLISKDQKILYKCFSTAPSITLPDTVKEIRGHFFMSLKYCNELNVPVVLQQNELILKNLKKYAEIRGPEFKLNFVDEKFKLNRFQENNNKIIEISFENPDKKMEPHYINSPIDLSIGSVLLVEDKYGNQNNVTVSDIDCGNNVKIENYKIIKIRFVDNKFIFRLYNNINISYMDDENVYIYKRTKSFYFDILKIPPIDKKITIPPLAFHDCFIKKLVLNKNIIKIEADAFKNSKIKSVVLEEGFSLNSIKDFTLLSYVFLRKIGKGVSLSKMDQNLKIFAHESFCELSKFLKSSTKLTNLLLTKDLIKPLRYVDKTNIEFYCLSVIKKHKNEKYSYEIMKEVFDYIFKNYTYFLCTCMDEEVFLFLIKDELMPVDFDLLKMNNDGKSGFGYSVGPKDLFVKILINFNNFGDENLIGTYFEVLLRKKLFELLKTRKVKETSLKANKYIDNLKKKGLYKNEDNLLVTKENSLNFLNNKEANY